MSPGASHAAVTGPSRDVVWGASDPLAPPVVPRPTGPDGNGATVLGARDDNDDDDVDDDGDDGDDDDGDE